MNWAMGINNLYDTLRLLSVKDEEANELEIDASFRLWLEMTLKIRAAEKTVYLIGNGASASMASHIAADLAKNGLVHTEVFTDMSLITAIANDISFAEVFAEPIRRRMAPGDMLVAISSSGQSPNIIRAAEEARLAGGTIITISAMQPQNILRTLGDLNLYVPAPTYGLAESSHAMILHYWMDFIADCTDRTARPAENIHRFLSSH